MSNVKKTKVANTNKKTKNISTTTKKTSEKKDVKKIFKTNEKHEKRLRNLVLATALCSLIIVSSTYAWFIGMKTVIVTPFDVSIAVTEGLSLSLNGSDWSEKVTINEGNYNDTSVVYAGNTNSWSNLVPMSSVGKINSTSSRLTLYKKGSFTVTPGGYRVMAKAIENGGAKELDGYVAFDLFIRNKSGNAYYSNVDIKNEEAIYLTPESLVAVAATGDNEENSGIENSVRVAFAQIGRVQANKSASIITGITCKTQGDVSGICDRTAQIWEPNDKAHVQNAISWYKSSCKKRTGADLTSEDSYSGNCNTITNGVYYPTYVINGEITETDRVDTYDGTEYNGYTASITSGKLYKFPSFTDSMKDLEGHDRPEFMRLAPNSVTKVRVYVYLEGQDIDNYDFASLGKKISVAFGFTKERFYGEDVDYNKDEPHGPTLPDGLQERN